MKELGIVGSPRKTGHTVKLVEAVLAGAQEMGHEIIFFHLCDLDIGPLEAENGKILYPDDGMVQLYPHIESIDAFILGSPIYYDHISSRAKLFIDRLHYYSLTHGEEYRKRFPAGVKCVNIITYHWDKVDAYDSVLDWMKERMEHYWKMQVVGNLKAENTRNIPVSERKDLLQQARVLGRSL